MSKKIFVDSNIWLYQLLQTPGETKGSDEKRIMTYTMAMQPWAARFRTLDLDHISLSEAHNACCVAAQDILPYQVLPT
jgi:hypothetical protein